VEIEKMQSTEREYLTKAGRKAAEEEKARADEELEAVARTRQMALSLSEEENATRKAVEQCEKGLELKRQELAQMEKEKDELLASASSGLEVCAF
jgi:Fe-S cluster assembly ATPase SufC